MLPRSQRCANGACVLGQVCQPKEMGPPQPPVPSLNSPESTKRGAWQPYLQQEKLVSRIQHTIQDYQCDSWDVTSFVVEYLANADDAGASEFAVVYDDNQYRWSKLLSPCLANWQGPALCMYNNSLFRWEDWKTLKQVGDSGKRNEGRKIGRFGLGVLTG